MKKQLIAAFKIICILTMGLLISGCRNQKAAQRNVDPTGVYVLVSIDGKQVPAEIAHEGSTLQIRSGSFVINGDGTCSSKITLVSPKGKEVVHEVRATYTKNGSTLNMQWEGAGTTVGTVKGNTFTMVNEGMTILYKK